ncbi:hypothetical protein SESBI_30689 [Sesbania bispinosa]|nr:hypothetical protein SESBI_30689 [Sesbania bispinosa]
MMKYLQPTSKNLASCSNRFTSACSASLLYLQKTETEPDGSWGLLIQAHLIAFSETVLVAMEMENPLLAHG